MAASKSSQLAHLVQNIFLVILSIFFLPIDTALLLLSLTLWPLTKAPRQLAPSQQRTVLVTGVGMTKGLVLARLFHEAGHRVIGADFSSFSSGRASFALKSFYGLSSPDGSTEGVEQYTEELLYIIRREGVSLWVSCSGVASAIEDGIAQEAIEKQRLDPDSGIRCRCVQFDSRATQVLHEKHLFIEHVKSLGLLVPETHKVTSHKELLQMLSMRQRENDERKKNGNDSIKQYILKPIGVDDAARNDMALLPLATFEQTASHLSRLTVSEDSPYILQEFITGKEYCTHALVVQGRVRAFVACPSCELLMHYEALSTSSHLHKAMLDFTLAVAKAGGSAFTGHLSFDFLVPKGKDGPGEVEIYPIECNPRAHTAVALLYHTPGLVEQYLLLVNGDRSLSSVANSDKTKFDLDEIKMPYEPSKVHWTGHDLVACLVIPLLSALRGSDSWSTYLGRIQDFVQYTLFWKDGTFELWDPIPWWWLYHIYWPLQFIRSIATGRKWSRVNVSTTKMFVC